MRPLPQSAQTTAHHLRAGTGALLALALVGLVALIVVVLGDITSAALSAARRC